MKFRMPDEPTGAWHVASAAARLYTEALQTVLPIAIPAALAAVVSELLQPEAGAAMNASAAQSLGVLLSGLIYAWLVIAVQHRVYRFAFRSGSTGESLRAAGARLLPLIGAGLLAAIGLALPIGVVAAIAAWAWQGREMAAAVVLGLAAVLAVVYVGLRLAVLTAEVVLRPAGPVESLRNSWRLTRGQVWHIALVYAVLLAVIAAVFVAAIIVSTVLGILAPSLAGFLASIVTVVLLSVFMLPFGGAVMATLWHDLRLRAGEPQAAD